MHSRTPAEHTLRVRAYIGTRDAQRSSMTLRIAARGACSRLTALSICLFSACTLVLTACEEEAQTVEEDDDFGFNADAGHEPEPTSSAPQTDAALPGPTEDGGGPNLADAEVPVTDAGEPSVEVDAAADDDAGDPSQTPDAAPGVGLDAGAEPDAAADAGQAPGSDVDAGQEPDAMTPEDGSAMVTFGQVQQFVFGSCGGGGAGGGIGGGHGGIPGPAASCHSGENSADGLDLLGDDAFDLLVNAASPLFPAEVLVIPGDAEGSFLLRKLTNDLPEDGSLGEPMPKGEAIRWQPLPDDQLELVREWIAAGAPR